jgi:hypothetical protein
VNSGPRAGKPGRGDFPGKAVGGLGSDRLAGLAIMAVAGAVWLLSTDLPVGSLSFPGSGLMPKLALALMAGLGAALAIGGGSSPSVRTLGWEDFSHAWPVVLCTACAIWLYPRIGFLFAVPALIFTLLLAERRNPLAAIAYALVTTFSAYALFGYLLRAPLPRTPFGF